MSVVVEPLGGLTPRGRTLSLAVAVASTTLSVLPVFLLGALAILVRRDLAFSQTELGAAASAFYGTSAIVSIPGGRLAQRLGPEHSMAIGAAISAISLVGIALFATSWATLFALLLLGGTANALAQPGANSAVARDQPPERQGTSFGILQTAIPLSTLLAGFAVPTIGLQVGWRWAFAAAALGAAPVALYSIRRHGPARAKGSGPRSTGQGVRKAPLYVLAAAGGFAAAPANAMGAFYVESAVAHGISTGAAGLWLVVGSACGVSGRLLWGWMTDRWRGESRHLMALLMVLGSGGFVLLGGSASRPLLFAGTVVAFGAGWAWKGLYNLTVVQQNPAWASAAVGITQAGVFAGSVFGPLGFGLIVERTSYGVAWTVSASALLIAAVLVWFEKRML